MGVCTAIRYRQHISLALGVAVLLAAHVTRADKPVKKHCAPDFLELRRPLATRAASAVERGHNALDLIGRPTLAVDIEEGKILWQTDEARTLIGRRFGGPDDTVPFAVASWIGRLRKPNGRTLPVLVLPQIRYGPRVIISVVARGKVWILNIDDYAMPTVVARLTEAFAITNREAETLYWIVRGKEYTEIAEILRIAPLTAKKHVENLLVKLDVKSRSQAAALAVQRVPSVLEPSP